MVSPANQGAAVAVSAAAAAAQQADCAHTTLQPATSPVPVSGSLFHLDLCINVMPCLSYLSGCSLCLHCPCGGERRMLMSMIAEMASQCLYCHRLFPQSYACSHLNEMCPAAAIYISREEERFLHSILLKILPFCVSVAFITSLSLSPAERELLLIATEAVKPLSMTI